MIKFFYRI